MKHKLRKLIPKRRNKLHAAQDGQAPRITNDTVAAHREEVLSSARKYIYPLQHSAHRIVLISTTLIITSLVVFMAYCVVALYRLESTSSFLYRVTQVVPFPVAKAGSAFVAYENYLFELRHYKYFYENQQKLDFNSVIGKQQLAEYRKRALEKVINDAYIKQLARAQGLSVTGREVDDEITVLRRQNRLGASEQTYEDALKQNFGWTPEDFKRAITQRLLEQKVISKLDTETHKHAEAALVELRGGADFNAVAAKYVADPAGKISVSDFGFVDKSNRDLMPQVTDALFKLKVGEVSGVINNGYALEILKALEINPGKVHGTHLVFSFQDVTTFINTQKAKHKARTFITP